MDNFIKRGAPQSAPANATKKKKQPTDFLTAASRKFEQNNSDVGVDIVGDLKDNLENVIGYYQLVKEFENIKGEIQQLQFADPYPTKEYRLIEVDNAMLEAFENGESFAFRGDPDENAVLCTGTRTYEVKETETSNTLVLTPKMTVANEVCGGVPILTTRIVPAMKQHYLELKEMGFVTRMKLKDILKRSELRDLCNDTNERVTLEALLDTVRMSEGELMEALEAWPVVVIDGCYRWLSIDIRRELLDGAVDTIDDLILSKDRSITIDLLRTNLKDTTKYPDELLEWLLRTHFKQVETTEEDGTSSIGYIASHDAFCRTRARQLLPLVKSYSLEEFEQKIEKIVPIGVVLKWEYLDGLALRTTSVTHGERIEYFDAEDLPENPRERLSILFTTRPTWTAEEAAPFMTGVLPRGTTVQGVLLQHCRAETSPTGSKIFCGLKPL